MLTIKEFYQITGQLPSEEDLEMPQARIEVFSTGLLVTLNRNGSVASKWLDPEDFIRQLSNIYTPVHVVEPGIQIISDRCLGMVVPAHKRKVKIQGKRKKKQVYLPHLLILGVSRPTVQYYLFATNEPVITEDSPLYLTSIPNVHGTSICFGTTTNQVPTPQSKQDLEDAFELFFGNVFTHDFQEFYKEEFNCKTYLDYAGNVREVLKGLLR